MTKKSNQKKSGLLERFKKDQQKAAEKTLIEELLLDMNTNRWQVYKVNLVRGIFFGFGSVLGGTVVIALLIWILAQIGAIVPFMSDFIRDILTTLNA